MNYLLALVYIPLCAFLDRWGGGGFDYWLLRRWPTPEYLQKGFKPARRFVLPGFLFLLNLSWQNFAALSILSFIFCFNLDEIEDRDWEEIFLWSLCLFFTLYQTCGYWALMPSAWWILGIYLSNYGLWGRRLDWFWVELLRGALLGLGVALYA